MVIYDLRPKEFEFEIFFNTQTAQFQFLVLNELSYKNELGSILKIFFSPFRISYSFYNREVWRLQTSPFCCGHSYHTQFLRHLGVDQFYSWATGHNFMCKNGHSQVLSCTNLSAELVLLRTQIQILHNAVITLHRNAYRV